ncbi:hypothetical protein POMI540_4645 [Schizosaccharomyces pombe]
MRSSSSNLESDTYLSRYSTGASAGTGSTYGFGLTGDRGFSSDSSSSSSESKPSNDKNNDFIYNYNAESNLSEHLGKDIPEDLSGFLDKASALDTQSDVRNCDSIRKYQSQSSAGSGSTYGYGAGGNRGFMDESNESPEEDYIDRKKHSKLFLLLYRIFHLI